MINVGSSYVYNLCVLFLWQMSRFGKSLHQRWDEDDESDDDDLLILAGLIEGSKRNKQKNFRGSLLGRHSVRRGILGGHDGIFRDYFAWCIRVLKPKDYEHHDPLLLNDFLKIHEEIEDRSSHERLRDDRVEHLWARYNAR